MLTRLEANNMQYWYWYTDLDAWYPWMQRLSDDKAIFIKNIISALERRDTETVRILTLWRMHGSPST